MALTASGIIEISSNINNYEARELAVRFFERAFTSNPRNPIALKYLAEHYFFRKQYPLAQEFSNAGIQVLKGKTGPERSDLPSFRQDLQILRSDFYFVLGKIEHV